MADELTGQEGSGDVYGASSDSQLGIAPDHELDPEALAARLSRGGPREALPDRELRRELDEREAALEARSAKIAARQEQLARLQEKLINRYRAMEQRGLVGRRHDGDGDNAAPDESDEQSLDRLASIRTRVHDAFAEVRSRRSELHERIASVREDIVRQRDEMLKAKAAEEEAAQRAAERQAIDAAHEDLAFRRKLLEQREAELLEREEQAQQRAVELDAVRRQLDAIARENHERRRTLEHDTRELDARAESLSEYAELIESREAETARAEQDLHAFGERVKELAGTVEQRRSVLVRQNQQLADAEQSLAGRTASFEQQRLDLEADAAAIAAREAALFERVGRLDSQREAIDIALDALGESIAAAEDTMARPATSPAELDSAPPLTRIAPVSIPIALPDDFVGPRLEDAVQARAREIRAAQAEFEAAQIALQQQLVEFNTRRDVFYAQRAQHDAAMQALRAEAAKLVARREKLARKQSELDGEFVNLEQRQGALNAERGLLEQQRDALRTSRTEHDHERAELTAAREALLAEQAQPAVVQIAPEPAPTPLTPTTAAPGQIRRGVVRATWIAGAVGLAAGVGAMLSMGSRQNVTLRASMNKDRTAQEHIAALFAPATFDAITDRDVASALERSIQRGRLSAAPADESGELLLSLQNTQPPIAMAQLRTWIEAYDARMAHRPATSTASPATPQLDLPAIAQSLDALNAWRGAYDDALTTLTARAVAGVPLDDVMTRSAELREALAEFDAAQCVVADLQAVPPAVAQIDESIFLGQLERDPLFQHQLSEFVESGGPYRRELAIAIVLLDEPMARLVESADRLVELADEQRSLHMDEPSRVALVRARDAAATFADQVHEWSTRWRDLRETLERIDLAAEPQALEMQERRIRLAPAQTVAALNKARTALQAEIDMLSDAAAKDKQLTLAASVLRATVKTLSQRLSTYEAELRKLTTAEPQAQDRGRQIAEQARLVRQRAQVIRAETQRQGDAMLRAAHMNEISAAQKTVDALGQVVATRLAGLLDEVAAVREVVAQRDAAPLPAPVLEPLDHAVALLRRELNRASEPEHGDAFAATEGASPLEAPMVAAAPALTEIDIATQPVAGADPVARSLTVGGLAFAGTWLLCLTMLPGLTPRRTA